MIKSYVDPPDTPTLFSMESWWPGVAITQINRITIKSVKLDDSAFFRTQSYITEPKFCFLDGQDQYYHQFRVININYILSLL